MPPRCTCFSAPIALRQLSRVSFYGGTNTSKSPRPRGYSTGTELSDVRTHRGTIFQRGNWQARRSQHGSAPPTHSSPIRPKQSLGQNFLQDRAVIAAIVDAFNANFERLSPSGSVIEIGAGTGALSTSLHRVHSGMLAVEIDARAVDFLREAHPGIEVLQGDVLALDWRTLAAERGAPLAVVGNLPYNIVSQILLSMLEAPAGVLSFAVVMMQREVAQRICARTSTKAYGILSVVGQLYARPTPLFDVPNTAFYPRPSITSTMVLFEFAPQPCLDVTNPVLTGGLRAIVRAAFQQRRKTLRNSLKVLCAELQVDLGEEWARKRPEEITPEEFVRLTRVLYAERLAESEKLGLKSEETAAVWRPRKV